MPALHRGLFFSCFPPSLRLLQWAVLFWGDESSRSFSPQHSVLLVWGGGMRSVFGVLCAFFLPCDFIHCLPYPLTLVVCSPFLQNSQVNFINVGVEQMLKFIQDFFVFSHFWILWLLLFLPPPTHKAFCVTSIKFGIKPLAGAVASEEGNTLFLIRFFTLSLNQKLTSLRLFLVSLGRPNAIFLWNLLLTSNTFFCTPFPF